MVSCVKQLTVLGSTGSIGKSTLEVIKEHRRLFSVYALSTYSNIELLFSQIREFSPKKVVISDYSAYRTFIDKFSSSLYNLYKTDVKILYGEEGLYEIVEDPNVDLVVNALVGFSGLKPTIKALQSKKNVALANKETIVIAGKIVLDIAKKNNVSVIPIDSEQNALLLLLKNQNKEHISKLIITASGGPFRDFSLEEIKNVTVKDALSHPTWNMGKKITIDSATLMNKGFEVIEAHNLFDFPYSSIETIIHKESIIHSLIETINGELYAQLGPRDMKFSIQNALTFPDIINNTFDRLDLTSVGILSFQNVDYEKFPLLKIAYEVGNTGGSALAVLNASNEVAVYAFLDNKINFYQIVDVVSHSLAKHKNIFNPTIEELYQTDNWARIIAEDYIKRIN